MTDGTRSLLASAAAHLEHLVSAVRFGQFLSVGVVGMVFDTAVIFLLTDIWSVPPLPAKLASAETAILVMFVLNERWTFARWGQARPTALLRRFLKSNLVRSGGVAVATAVLLALNIWFGVWVVLANVVGIGVGFVVNYVAESLFTWRVHRE
jgi:putative flippase GtrA